MRHKLTWLIILISGICKLALADNTVGPIISMSTNLLEHNDHYMSSIAISPDSRYAIYDSDHNTIKMLDISSGIEIRSFIGHKLSISSVDISQDGRYALSASNEKIGSSLYTDIRSFEVNKGISSVQFSPDGRYVLVSGHDSSYKGYVNSEIQLWDVSSGAKIGTFKGNNYIGALSPDGSYLLYVVDNIIKLWNVSTGS